MLRVLNFLLRKLRVYKVESNNLKMMMAEQSISLAVWTLYPVCDLSGKEGGNIEGLTIAYVDYTSS